MATAEPMMLAAPATNARASNPQGQPRFFFIAIFCFIFAEMGMFLSDKFFFFGLCFCRE
jgi:hypothetical protein